MSILLLISKIRNNTLAIFLCKIFVGSSILAIFAQITIPLPYVPMTGQTFGLMLMSFILGSHAAVGSVLLYLLEGIIGLPVFAGLSFGLPVLFGTTGGYLFGHIPAAFLLGYCADKQYFHSFFKTSLCILLGLSMVFIFGLLQLSLFIPKAQLLSIGLYPFIIGDLLKGLLMLLISIPLYKYNQRKNSLKF